MKKFTRVFSSLVLALAIAVSAAIIPASAAKVKLNKKNVTIVKGYTTTLKVSGTKKKVSWSSKDERIATVSSKGKVTAKKIGSTVITAKTGSYVFRCSVRVVGGKLSVSKNTVTVDMDKTVKVKISSVGSHSLGVSVGSETIATASWKKAKWKGNSIYLTIRGAYPGETRIKVYQKDYPKSVYKYIDVTVKDPKSSSSASSTTDGKDSSKGSESDDVSEMSYAEQVLYYCNIERENAGVSPLTLDSTLCSAAEVRANEITESFSHTRPDGSSCFSILDEYNYDFRAVGENIARGQSSAKTVVEDWMNSEGHRKNILNSNYTNLGVGKSGKYWVQLFSQPA